MAFGNNKIKFLQGTYENLNKMTSSEAGAFYITNDTHEMFLGVDSSKPPVALNRWVDIKQTWEEITKLSDYQNHPGKIYYAINENILCTYNGSKWVQINPDHNDNTILSNVQISAGEVYTEDNKQKLKYVLTFRQTDIYGAEINPDNPLTASLVIDEDQIDSLVLDIKVGLTSTVDTNNIATIKTIGDGADENQGVVTIAGKNGVVISEGTSNGVLTITGTTYNLTTADDTSLGKVQLIDSEGEAKSVDFKGDEWIGVSSNKGEVTLIHKTADSSNSNEVTKITATDKEISKETRTFKAITGAKADANGHIVSIEETEFTVPSSNFSLQEDVAVLSGETDKTYTTAIYLRDENDGGIISTANINTKHTIVVDGQKNIIENGGSLGNFYSKSAIDNKLKEIDAMVYKGTIDKESNLPTDNVKIGYTYKASKDFSMTDGRQISKGDLLIANGTEEINNGEAFITGTINWDHIESGADADTTYQLQGVNNEIQLYDNVLGGVESRITTSGDNWINTTVANNELKIEHKGSSAQKNTSSSNQTLSPTAFNVVTDVITDDKGHTTEVNITPVVIPELKFINSVSNETPNLTIQDDLGENKGEIEFLDGNKIVVSGTVDSNSNKLSITVDHDLLEKEPENITPDAKVSIPLDGTGSVTVLDEVIVDDYGHITGYKQKTIEIERETTYELTTPTLSDNIVTQALKNHEGTETGKIQLSSDTLTYKVESDIIKADLLWGSF